jgi:hypothetical protein
VDWRVVVRLVNQDGQIVMRQRHVLDGRSFAAAAGSVSGSGGRLRKKRMSFNEVEVTRAVLRSCSKYLKIMFVSSYIQFSAALKVQQSTT